MLPLDGAMYTFNELLFHKLSFRCTLKIYLLKCTVIDLLYCFKCANFVCGSVSQVTEGEAARLAATM